MPTLTIIAGCGYLGTCLAHELLASGRPVLALTRQKTSVQTLAASGISALVCDLRDPASVAAAAVQCSGPQVQIVHCAASGRGGGIDDYRAIYLEGCRNLRAAFPSAKRFFFTSSTSVYPQINGEIVTEMSPAVPDRETGRMLRQTEEETLAAGGWVGRLAGIYGPGRSILLSNYLASKAVIDVRSAPPATPNGRWINQIHVRDAARAVIHLLDLPDPTGAGVSASADLPPLRLWNISDSTPLLQRPLYTRLSQQFNLPLPPDALPDLDRKRGWTHKQVSNAHLLASGWVPLYPDWFAALEHDRAFLPSIQGTVSVAPPLNFPNP